MILSFGDKRNLTQMVAQPFLKLAAHNEGSLARKASIRVFKEKYQPILKSMEEQYAEIYHRLADAQFIEYQGLNGETAFTKIPQAWGKLPFLKDITSTSDWHSGQASCLILREDIAEALKEDEKETFEKSTFLMKKSQQITELMTEWLKPFTMPEQLQFSLPQLGYFLGKMDFRKRRSWADNEKPAMKTQRRPRVINVPPDELRALVMEATILDQSPVMKEIKE